jgi:diaminopropionate ammonia-lyase
MFSEIDAQLGERVPDLIAVPTGVGSLLLAALQHRPSTGSGHMGTSSGHMATSSGHEPAVLAVEPVTAACVTASLAAHASISVDTSVPTIMAGLNCGTISTIAWPVIRDQLEAAVTVTDDQARVAMQRLHELGIRAGPSGAASLAGVRVALTDANQRAALATREDSVVILINTEGLVE